MHPHTHTHKNGFRHVYQTIHTSEPTAYIYLYCNVGSAMEPQNLRGASHFIEHMCFKGSHKHPKSIDFIRVFDRTGAYFNAFTTNRFTLYVVKCHRDDLAILLDTLSDGVLNATFSPKEYHKELKVVVEESVKNLDDHQCIIENDINKLVYSGTPFEYPVDCYDYHKKNKDNDISKRELVIDFYKTWYRPQNMILSVASNLSNKQFEDALRGTAFLHGPNALPMPPFPALYTPPSSQMSARYQISGLPSSPKTSYISISFRVCEYNSPDKYVLDLLAELFSGFFSSKLFVALREENGLTYLSDTNTEYYESCGDFTIFAISDVSKLFIYDREHKKGVLPIIVDTLNEILKHGPSNEELHVTKLNMHRSREISNVAENCAEYNGEWVLMHPNNEPPVPFQQEFDTYYATITRDKIRDVARKYFKRENMSVRIFGNGVKQREVENQMNRLVVI